MDIGYPEEIREIIRENNETGDGLYEQWYNDLRGHEGEIVLLSPDLYLYMGIDVEDGETFFKLKHSNGTEFHILAVVSLLTVKDKYSKENYERIKNAFIINLPDETKSSSQVEYEKMQESIEALSEITSKIEK